MKCDINGEVLCDIAVNNCYQKWHWCWLHNILCFSTIHKIISKNYKITSKVCTFCQFLDNWVTSSLNDPHQITGHLVIYGCSLTPRSIAKTIIATNKNWTQSSTFRLAGRNRSDLSSSMWERLSEVLG